MKLSLNLSFSSVKVNQRIANYILVWLTTVFDDFFQGDNRFKERKTFVRCRWKNKVSLNKSYFNLLSYKN